MTRRALLGGAVGALAVSPFIIKHFRKTMPLPYTATYEIERDTSVVPSGKVDVFNDFITFRPLTLPGGDIRSWTLNASLSGDNKWLFVSYCFGEDYRSHICCAPLDKFGLPETFIELKNFDSQSVIVGLGCSSLTNRGNSHFSYHWLEYKADMGISIISMSCVSLRQNGKKLEFFPDSVLLSKVERPAKKLEEVGAVGLRNHCWIGQQDIFFFAPARTLLVRANGKPAQDGGFTNLHHLLQEGMSNMEPRSINSNLFLDGEVVKFLSAPVRPQNTDKWDRVLDPYRTDPDGLLFSFNFDGTIKSRETFPVPLFSRKTLITKTHCLFPDRGHQRFLTASLEKPQDYIQLGFAMDEVQMPDSGINYVYDPLAILSSGRHLLCARDVGRSYVDKAKKLGLPLSTLEIVELPFKVG